MKNLGLRIHAVWQNNLRGGIPNIYKKEKVKSATSLNVNLIDEKFQQKAGDLSSFTSGLC
jgi:hypothetical protein